MAGLALSDEGRGEAEEGRAERNESELWGEGIKKAVHSGAWKDEKLDFVGETEDGGVTADYRRC